MNYQYIKKIRPLRFLANWIWMEDAKNKFNEIEGMIDQSSNLLDFGSGLGTVTNLLKRKGYLVTPLDIANHSFYDDSIPVIYDGVRSNFENNTFDVVLILTVLHHVADQEQIIDESLRIGRRIVIIEDVYRNKLQKYITYFFDSLVNLEFKGHPHSNRSTEGWKALFDSKGIQLIHLKEYRYMLFFRQVVFVLEQK